MGTVFDKFTLIIKIAASVETKEISIVISTAQSLLFQPEKPVHKSLEYHTTIFYALKL